MFLRIFPKQICVLFIFMGCNQNVSLAAQSSPQIIGVFCSADNKIPQTYKDTAAKLGQMLQKKKYDLMTGGSNTGLMKEVTDGFCLNAPKEAFKNVHGVLPTVLKDYKIQHALIPADNITWTDTLSHRLDTFLKKCDHTIILPGGFGTLHELMHFLVSQQFGLCNKKIILLNIDGFWDGLLTQFQTMQKKNALSAEHLAHLTITTTVEEVMKALEKPCQENHGLTNRYWGK